MRKVDKISENKTKYLLKQKKKCQFKLCHLNASIFNFLPSNNKKIYTKKDKVMLALAGSVIGLINGFFGGGGGMICVPILQKILRLNAKESHATAIMVIFPLSLVSACIYVFNGFVQTYPLLAVSVGVIIGGIIGAFFLKILPPKAVRIIFAVIMLAGGIKLII